MNKFIVVIMISALILVGFQTQNPDESVIDVVNNESYDFAVSTTSMERQLVTDERFATGNVLGNYEEILELPKEAVKELLIHQGDVIVPGTPLFIKRSSMLDSDVLNETMDALMIKQRYMASKWRLLDEISADPVIIPKSHSILMDFYHDELLKDPYRVLSDAIHFSRYGGRIIKIDKSETIKITWETYGMKAISFSMNAEDSKGVKVGDSITSLDGEFEGYVLSVKEEEINGVKLINVEGVLEDPFNRLNVGDFVSVKIIIKVSYENTIPRSLVRRIDNNTYVYTVIDEYITKEFVELGQVFGDYVVVKYGLRSSDILVASGAKLVDEGDLVKIIN